MRRLILSLAAGAIAVWATFAVLPAAAQSLTSMVCGRYDAPYGGVAKGSDVKALEAAERAVPAACPLHAQIVRRLEVLKVRAPKPTTLAAKPKPKAEVDTDDNTDDDMNSDKGDQTLAANDAAPPPAPATPLDPCSVAGIDSLDPALPEDGPPAGLAPARRADLAQRYMTRATKFDACSDPADAKDYFAAAVATDTQSFVAVAAKAHFELEQGDLADAIADDTTAIALRSHAPTDVNPLSAYADRADAYGRQQLYAQQAADLNTIVDHFNDQAHDKLDPYSAYKERLAKAYLREGDEADATKMFAVTEERFLDWEDQAFLGHTQFAAGQWDAALDRFAKALDGAPKDAAHAPQRAQIEVAVGQAYQSRARDGDVRAAWEAFRSAAGDDPSNTDARAALAALGQPLAAPTFTPPDLPQVQMPAGVSDLAVDRPPPFCDVTHKNDYLDSVKAASAQVNANMQALGAYTDAFLRDRAGYDSNKLLTYAEKIEDLKLFDAEWQRVDAQNTALRKLGDGLIAFFNRIRADDSLVVFCKDSSAGH
jgi:tetratricopeptide (TPR) repeat protein